MHIQWAGLFFIAYGLYAFINALLSPLGFRRNFRSGIIEAIFGQLGARIFFLILGATFTILGILIFFSILKPAH